MERQADHCGQSNIAKEKEVSDVMMAIRSIDEKFSDADERPIICVAIKMKNLPDQGDISELSVRNRLSVLEAPMSEMLDDRATHAATARAERATYAATGRDGHSAYGTSGHSTSGSVEY